MGMFAKFRGMLGGSRREGDSARLTMCVFGKHPAWDDHMEDIGLDTDHLVDLKEALYWDGVKGNLDAGAWTRELDASDRLDGFDHVFLWRAGPNTDLGHIWASRDGKGRTDYPMFACVSGEHVDPGWLIARGGPIVARVHEACVSATTAAEVARVVAEAQESLDAMQRPPYRDTPADDEALRVVASREPFSTDAEALVRMLYDIEREVGPGERSSSSTRTRLPAPTHYLRVPACAGDVVESLSVWSGVMQRLVRGGSVFLCRPRHADWIDVVIGRPGSAEFFPVLAGDRKIPPVTSIPYEIDEADRRRLLAVVQGV